MAVRLFVYGSLRRGGSAHALLEGARFLGAARTAPGFELWDCGEYPGIGRGGPAQVVGELYEVPDAQMAKLDEYEGPLYAREILELEGGGQAEAYVLTAAAEEIRVALVDCGDWMARAKRPRP